MLRFARSLVATTIIAALPSFASADIFQWEYLDPFDPSLGKRQSTTLCPGGAGVSAAPAASLTNLNLTKAYLIGADLTGARFDNSNLTNASFAGASLINARVVNATVTGADFGGAVITGAILASLTSKGFTPAQFYSTASYVNGDLLGVNLGGNSLTGWNLSGKNLAGASFHSANLTGADLSNSDLTNATFTSANLAGTNLAAATSRGFTRSQLFSSAFGWVGTNLSSNDFSGWDFRTKHLTGANLSRSNLTGADLRGARLQDVDLTDAVIRGAKLAATTGDFPFTAAQLYSTASYKSGDLTGVDLGNYETPTGNNLTAWSFAGKDLTGSRFARSNLTNANFTAANLTNSDLTAADLGGAALLNANLTDAIINEASFFNTTAKGLTAQQFYATAGYKSGNLTGVSLSQNNLAGWNFAGKNLTRTRFSQSNLTGADFTGATVSGAFFNETTSRGFSPAQLYSTAGYQARDLSGVYFPGNNFTGWNFSGQNLSNTSFSQANLSNADVTNARFTGAVLFQTRFWGADARGAIDLLSNPTSPNFNSMIRPDGSMNGLNFSPDNRLLTIRDYDGDPPRGIGRFPIVVNGHASFSSGTISTLFDADAWDSTISFATNISVSLTGGTLELGFAPGVDLPSQFGRLFQVFGWFGVTPTGQLTVSSPLHWDTSRLHTTGQVRFLPSMPGDANLDGIVGIADYFAVDRARATRLSGGWAAGDFNYSGGSPNAEDYLLMDRSFLSQRAAGPASPAHSAPVPEPAALTALTLAVLATRRRRPC
jgi:uncharacterized protein YjbI with pentapeptide repeats